MVSNNPAIFLDVCSLLSLLQEGGRRNPCFNVGMYLGEVGLLIGLILRLYRGGCSISRGKEEKALG